MRLQSFVLVLLLASCGDKAVPADADVTPEPTDGPLADRARADVASPDVRAEIDALPAIDMAAAADRPPADASAADAVRPDGGSPAAFSAADIAAVARRVADYHLANPSSRAVTDWVPAAFYTGVMAIADALAEPKYRQAMRDIAERARWMPGTRMRHADDHAVTQTYLELYLLDKLANQIAPTVALFDELVKLPYNEPLTWGGGIENREWAWCDALYMAPPALALATRATGDRKYIDLMHRQWWKTTDYLLDPAESLYYRDSRFFNRKSANGQKVFWSRGNGWVFAGLARVLRDMPANYPDRARYETLFKRMAERLMALQKADGYWPSSLLDAADPPGAESSGTAFFTFGLAWGANNGLLDRAVVLPRVRAGWAALVQAVQPNGRLGWVQPIGFDPQPATANTSEPYGAGAFLLAASELHRWATR